MPDVTEALAAMRRALFADDFTEGEARAREVLESLPSCLAAQRGLAWAQLGLGDAAALESFQSCAALDPEDPLAEVGQAIWYEAHGQPEQAMAHYTRACELDPMDQRIRREVVRLGGQLPETPLAEGVALLQAGQPDPASGRLRQAAAAVPVDVTNQLVLATCLWRLGGKQQAYNLATSVLTARPQCVKALLLVLAVEASSGRLLRTRELLARAEQVDPGLVLYADWVRELGLTPVIERYRASRQAGALGR